MLIDFFADIFIKGGVIVPLLLILLYRVLAVSFSPRFSSNWAYWLFCLSIVLIYMFISPFDESDKGGLALFFLILFIPYIVIGKIEIHHKWHWPARLISCILELLTFPVWFFLVFNVALMIEGGD